MIRTELRAYVPVLRPIEFEARDHWQIFEETMDEFNGLQDTITLPTPHKSNWSELSFQVFDLQSEGYNLTEEEVDYKFHEFWTAMPESVLNCVSILKISVQGEFEEQDALTDLRKANPTPSSSDADLLGMWKFEFNFELKSIVNYLMLAANIARPGSFRIDRGYIFQDGRVTQTTNRIVTSLDGAVDCADRLAWLKLKSLTLSSVWKWMMDNELYDGAGVSPLSRAFNAFSYCFSDVHEDENVELFWALIGIEALYAKGSVKVMEQIVEKCQIFLGSWTTHKKSFSRMYDTRSKFIHGALSFPNKFTDPTHLCFDKFHKELYEATDLAQAILLATFQKMIEKGWGELNFSFVINDPTSNKII